MYGKLMYGCGWLVQRMGGAMVTTYRTGMAVTDGTFIPRRPPIRAGDVIITTATRLAINDLRPTALTDVTQSCGDSFFSPHSIALAVLRGARA